MSRRYWLIGVLFAAVLLGNCKNKTSSEQPAYTAEQSLAAMEFSEDFHAEVFLKEPQVMSPVEMVFDEDGRIFVAEMLDYPDDPPAGKPVRSRIRMLEDVDGDGKYEKATIYADQVLQVSGILPWKGGLFVTSAPDILYMKDNDGDGKADTREVWYTGFPKVNPEARITNLRLNVDNWIYASNHGRDGTITSPKFPNMKPLLVRGADFRFNPITGEAETTSGVAQFGLTFDEWGNRFITENTVHLRHVVLPMNYIARAPLLEVPAYSYDISDHGKPSAPMYPLTGPQEWRKQRTELRQKRYDENNLNRKEQVGGYFSAASGSMFYNGDAWPEEYKHSIFTGDVSGNLIHRDVITPDGVTFKASRAKDGTEFIASKDQWFRPCNFANAPDGNLYVMDVYRLFIETPESIPEEIKKGMDFYAGDTMGRIYKIVHNKSQTQRNLKPNLSKATTEELVKLLEHPNGWHRQTAQRLLLELQDKLSISLLKEAVEKSVSAIVRFYALSLLDGVSALDEKTLLKGFTDSDARVRELALRLSEKRLSTSKDLQALVISTHTDSDLRVQFQLALTIGQLKGEGEMQQLALQQLLKKASAHGDNSWFRLAILSSVADRSAMFFKLLRSGYPSYENKELFTQLGSLIGAKHDTAEIAGFIKGLNGLKEPEAGLTGLAKGLNLAGVKNLPGGGIENALLPFLNNPNDAVSKAAWESARFFELKGLIDKAMNDLAKADLDPKKKVLAIRALRGGQYAKVAPMLEKILSSNEAGEIKIPAVESLSSFDEKAVAPTLLAAWTSYTPDVRPKVLEALLSEKERMKILLKALEENKLEKSALGEEMRTRLYEHPEKEVADRARALLKGASDDRMQMVEKYKAALTMNGDQTRGKKIFDQYCAVCHIPQKGGRIGADLSGVNNKTKDELLTSILNPSYSIEPRFINYVVTTNDGRIRNGILLNETPGAITLRAMDGDTTILRQNLKEMKASQMSLMPAAFEGLIDQQGMADLIAYLRAGL